MANGSSFRIRTSRDRLQGGKSALLGNEPLGVLCVIVGGVDGAGRGVDQAGELTGFFAVAVCTIENQL